MKLLIDTHILLWGLTESRRLSRSERAALRRTENRVYVSVASLWEIAIKARDGDLEAPDDLLGRVQSNPDFEILPVLAEHAWRVKSLPALHRDPFDHLLIAQALCEGMTLMTHDRWIARYEAPIFTV